MVIFFDIDGTLIDDTTQVIPQSTVDSIHALVAAGHIPVVNTGRPYSHVDPRVRAMPFAGWICAGGQEVLLQGKWLKKQVVPMEWMPTMIHEVRKNNLQVVYEAEDGFYLDGDYSNKHPEILRQSDLIRKIDCYVRDISEGIHHDVVKFCVFDIPDSNRAAFVKAMEPWFDAIDRRGMAEFLIKGNSKAAGMQMVLDAVGCAVEDTMAFGDSGNDLPMLKAAGIGVCMGNGVQEAKDAADYVTKTVLEDGIFHALNHFHLI
jgi:Cof subfamily protein (haloacid dehalogenase superfamily)